MRRCRVCTHVERPAIESALIRREPERAVASRFGLSRASLQRHRAAHLPAAVTQAAVTAEIARADDLVAEAQDLQIRTRAILAAAEQGREWRTALLAIRTASANLELLARFLPDRPAEPAVKVTSTEEKIIRLQELLDRYATVAPPTNGRRPGDDEALALRAVTLDRKRL